MATKSEWARDSADPSLVHLHYHVHDLQISTPYSQDYEYSQFPYSRYRSAAMRFRGAED